MTNNSNQSLSREVEEAIQEYLGKIESRLKSVGSDASDARAILADLETQIRTLLMEKGPAPTWNDLTAVLSEMDSPDKFSAGGETVQRKKPSCMVIGFSLAIIVVIAVLFAVFRSEGSSGAVTETPEQDILTVTEPAPVTVSETLHPEEAIVEPVVPPVPVEVPEALAEPAPEVLPEPVGIPIAIASFSSAANVRDANTVRLALSDGLINYLSGFHGIRVVERERIREALQDLRMSSEGMIDQSTALRLGHMTGARIIVTGNILQIDDQLVITARLINTETSELVATRAKGSRGNLLEVVDELAEGIADRMIQNERGVLGRVDDRSKKRASQQKKALQNQLKGKELPRLLVLLPETHLNRVIPDPAGETELVEWLLASGFTVASAEYAGIQKPAARSQWDSETDIQIRRPGDQEERQWSISSQTVHAYVTDGLAKDAEKLLEVADVLILGEGISERASQRSGIVSCKARLELKVIDIKTGELFLTQSTYGAGLDVAEHIAGKRALQAAGQQMALDLIPDLVARWTESQASQSETGTP